MRLSNVTESGAMDGAARTGAVADGSIDESPREIAIAGDSAPGIISAERRAPSAERRAPSAERRAPSAERRGHDCTRTCAEPRGGLSLPVLPPATRASLPNPLRFLFAVPRPRTGAGSRVCVRGGLAAALVLLVLAALAPAGPAQAQTEVFSTTVTVGSYSNIRGFDFATGGLSGDGTGTFTYKGSSFFLNTLTLSGGNLNVDFGLTGQTGPTYAAAYSLCLDGEKAAGWTGAFTTNYSAASSLSWTAGQMVAVESAHAFSGDLGLIRSD